MAHARRVLTMKRVAMLFAGMSLATPAHAVDSSGWLKERMYRVAMAAGQDAEPVRATLSDEMVLRLDQPGGTIAVPRALIALAPSPEAIDGLLALILSYSVPLKAETRGNGRGVAIGASGGALPGNEDRTRPRSASSDRAPATPAPDPAAQRKQRAWRGVGWYSRTRGCTAMLVEYLRLIALGGSAEIAGKRVTWRASRSAREILTDMGTLAYPSGEQCRARTDPEFEAVKADAAASVPASATGPQFGP